jgi:hypothetical protein
MEKLKQFFEEYAFGVCSRLGEKLNFPIDSIRLFFIYSSFVTLHKHGNDDENPKVFPKNEQSGTF